MKKIYKYEGEYGIFEVNLKEKKIIRDELDREKIWADAQEDYINQQHIYGTIIDELFGDDIDKIFPPRHENEYWCGKPTDFGYMAFNDDVKIIVDAAGTFIHERNGHRDAYRYYHEAFCVECAFNPYNDEQDACQRIISTIGCKDDY